MSRHSQSACSFSHNVQPAKNIHTCTFDAIRLYDNRIYKKATSSTCTVTRLNLRGDISRTNIGHSVTGINARRNENVDEDYDDYEKYQDDDDDDDPYHGNRDIQGKSTKQKRGSSYDNNGDYSSDSADHYEKDYDYDYEKGDSYRGDYEDDDMYYDDEEEEPRTWEWETHGKATHVYLPPPLEVGMDSGDLDNGDDNDNREKQRMPKTIIHFIGGTLFGSYPLKFYGPLLEQIAESSNSILIATSIPITFNKNPLNHFQLAKNVAKDFNRAYRDIIVDEYGKSASNQMKVVGMGHSLGSRLQMVISTSKSLKKIGFDRKANILLSFNNYSAVESVPGVKGLEKGIQDTLFGNGNKSRNRRSRPDAYYDEYEIGLGDVVNAVSEGIQDQVSSLKTAITPDLDEKSLEFQPSPQQLWDGIGNNYDVDDTLVVQFDRDLIDQSSRLAKVIFDSSGIATGSDQNKTGGNIRTDYSSSSETEELGEERSKTKDSTVEAKQKDENEGDAEGEDVKNRKETRLKDVKFARLKGVHLSPVQDDELGDLVSTIARYVTDIVGRN